MNWVVGILLALIIALLIKIIADIRRLIQAGSYDGDTDALEEGLEALEDALQLVESIDEEERSPTEAECQRLKAAYETAQASGISGLTLNPLFAALQRLCPDVDLSNS